ncbi:MAG: discoidin domain-containing protein, partial [Verrucomicrobiota bacterium]
YWPGSDQASMTAGVATNFGYVQNTRASLLNSGIPLICYEGGSDNSASEGVWQAPFQQQLYVNALTTMNGGVQGIFNQYTHTGKTWGLKYHTGDANSISPKWVGFLQWLGTTAPPTDLALNKTATSSSNESSSYPAAYAVDGSSTTRWSSAFSDPQWIYVDLGASHTINEVKLNWETACGKDYVIQVAPAGTSSAALTTDTPWTTIYTVTGNTTPGWKDYILSASGQFVRVKGTARATSYGYSLYDFNVMGL